MGNANQFNKKAYDDNTLSKGPSLLSAKIELEAFVLYSDHVNSLYKLSSPPLISDVNGAIFSLKGGPPK